MYDYAWVVLDLFAVLVLLYMVNKCATAGFVRTLVRFLGYMLSVFIAVRLSTVAATLLYDNIVEDALRMFLSRKVEGLLVEGTSSAVLLDAVPEGMQRIMQQAGRDLLQIGFDGDAVVLAQSIVDEALQSPVMSILRSICFFVIFSLSMVVVRRFSYLFGGLYKIPVIGTANTFLGGVIGVAEGVFTLYLVAIGLRLIIYLTGGELPFLNESVLEATYIYRVFF